MSSSITVPSPATLYSSLVAIHLDEIKAAIAKALEHTTTFEIKGRCIKVLLDVSVSGSCWTYFKRHGHGQLGLSQWTIQTFAAEAAPRIAIGLIGEFQSADGYLR